MEIQEKQTSRKNGYEKVTFEHKLFVIDQIKNGQISANFASKKYNICFASSPNGSGQEKQYIIG